MEATFSHGLSPQHPDYELMKRLEDSILRHAGGMMRFRKTIPLLLRKAIDEVIDSARTNRFTLDEVEKTEKTYLGTKVEILLRNFLKMDKGMILDLSVDGIETDIKNTVGTTWTIPSEAMGHPCILIKTQEKGAICSFGIVVIRDQVLNLGVNRDGKRSISKAGLEHVHWLLKDEPYPENFWQNIDPMLRKEITSPRGGTERVAVLFRRVQGRAISRALVQAVAQQRDYMKRIRRNGGARDVLAPEGIAILWGKKDREIICRLGLPACGQDEFISFRPVISEDVALLMAAHHID
jgi:hypothetical protein